MAQKRINAALSLDGLGDDARASFDLASTLGYRGIVIPTNHPQLSPGELSASAKRQIKKILEGRDLCLDGLRVAGPRGGLSTPESIDRTVDNARKAIALAFDLGVKQVSVNAGSLAHPQSAQSAAKIIAQEADRAGITVAFSADETAGLATLLKAVAFEYAKANFESARAIGAGADPIAAAETLAGMIAQFTAADAVRAGKSVRMVELGQGQVALGELLAALRDMDFAGPVVVDVRHLSNAILGAEHAAAILRPLLGSKS